LGGGWKFRVDPPHTGSDTGKYHVHVNYGNKEVGSEAVDGSKSHGDNMNNVPNSVKKKVKNHPEYKKGQEKQKKLDAAKSQIKSRNLKIDWWHIADVIIAIGIVIAATATFFFPGDDVGAWINFLRAIGAA
jgi:anti-sigma28 factor (negative regulator of flagellin synthesis)